MIPWVEWEKVKKKKKVSDEEQANWVKTFLHGFHWLLLLILDNELRNRRWIHQGIDSQERGSLWMIEYQVWNLWSGNEERERRGWVRLLFNESFVDLCPLLISWANVFDLLDTLWGIGIVMLMVMLLKTSFQDLQKISNVSYFLYCTYYSVLGPDTSLHFHH